MIFRNISTRFFVSVVASLVILGAVSSILLSPAQSAADSHDNEYARFNEKAELLVPEDWRKWVFVGTPLTPNDMNNGKAAFQEFHNVYIDPISFEHYSRTGDFREGTILVKELVSVGTKQAVSGKGYFQGEFQGLEATVKSKKRFPNEPGNWAYFSFGHELPYAKSGKARLQSVQCDLPP